MAVKQNLQLGRDDPAAKDLGNLILGAFMTLGIGMYAPCMIMVSLMGLDPRAAFPIMMGSCAFLMPVAGMRFVRKDSYALRPALGQVVGGIPGVLAAAFIVGSLPLTAIRWLVVVVVTYAAIATQSQNPSRIPFQRKLPPRGVNENNVSEPLKCRVFQI